MAGKILFVRIFQTLLHFPFLEYIRTDYQLQWHCLCEMEAIYGDHIVYCLPHCLSYKIVLRLRSPCKIITVTIDNCLPYLLVKLTMLRAKDRLLLPFELAHTEWHPCRCMRGLFVFFPMPIHGLWCERPRHNVIRLPKRLIVVFFCLNFAVGKWVNLQVSFKDWDKRYIDLFSMTVTWCTFVASPSLCICITTSVLANSSSGRSPSSMRKGGAKYDQLGRLFGRKQWTATCKLINFNSILR